MIDAVPTDALRPAAPLVPFFRFAESLVDAGKKLVPSPLANASVFVLGKSLPNEEIAKGSTEASTAIGKPSWSNKLVLPKEVVSPLLLLAFPNEKKFSTSCFPFPNPELGNPSSSNIFGTPVVVVAFDHQMSSVGLTETAIT